MKTANSPCKSPAEQERDDDLLLAMAMHDEEPETAEHAWQVFYERHRKYMFVVCKNALGRPSDTGPIEDLVHDVFIRVFERAADFDVPGSDSAELVRRKVRGWMAEIAKHLLVDGVRRKPILVDGETRATMSNTCGKHNGQPMPVLREQAVRVSEFRSLIAEAMGRLTEKQREILIVSYHYYEPGRPHQRLPEEVVDELARRFNTTAANTRQIRKRATDLIREYVVQRK